MHYHPATREPIGPKLLEQLKSASRKRNETKVKVKVKLYVL